MSSVIINNAPRSPGLLDQPNEVLQIIVGFLPKRSFIKFVGEDGVRRKVSQYLVVAQVCQRLRTAVLEADFWQDPDFAFYHLVARPRLPRPGIPSVAHEMRVGGLARTLLDDVHFVQCLSRKKEWAFESIETLLTVALSGRWFFQNAETVNLDVDRNLNIAMRSLSICRQLKRLVVDCMWDRESDLSLISEYLPNLTELHLLSIYAFKGSL